MSEQSQRDHPLNRATHPTQFTQESEVANNDLENGDDTETRKKKFEKFKINFKNMEIPDYLFKSSNSYFRKASRQERKLNFEMLLKSRKQLDKLNSKLKDSKKDNVQVTQRNREAKKEIMEKRGLQKVDKLGQISEVSSDDELEKKLESLKKNSKGEQSTAKVSGFQDIKNLNHSMFRSVQEVDLRSIKNKLNPSTLSPQTNQFKHKLNRQMSPDPNLESESLSRAQDNIIQFGPVSPKNNKERSDKYSEGSSLRLLPSPSKQNKANLKQNEDSRLQKNLCSVCFDKGSDSVYMPCGHGGLCFNCAIEIWKKSDDCYLCREVRIIFTFFRRICQVLINFQPIFQVLQIELNTKHQDGYYKVIASTEAFEGSSNMQIEESGYEIIH